MKVNFREHLNLFWGTREKLQFFLGNKGTCTPPWEALASSVVDKKNKVNEQNFDGEANWSGVVNFYCMQMSLLMSMRFIFNDD